MVLHDSQNRILRIILPVDADGSKLSLFKTELHAILGAFILLQRLIPPALRSSTSETIWSDSESSINRLNEVHINTPQSHRQSLSPEFPIIAEINNLQEKFPKVALEWLESHQEVRNLSQCSGQSDSSIATKLCR